jgi:hypothetical protein
MKDENEIAFVTPCELKRKPMHVTGIDIKKGGQIILEKDVGSGYQLVRCMLIDGHSLGSICYVL